MKQPILSFKRVQIAATGSAVPETIVTSAELAAKLGTDPGWVETNLGFRERRIVQGDETTSDLATKAARAALDQAGLTPNEVQLIIVATATADRKAPSTACLVQHKLGITSQCPAFDVSAVCSGFLYAMTIAAQFVELGTYRNALIIGADTFSTITDWTKRESVFFGDGAGAVLLSRSDREDRFFASMMAADGSGSDNFTVFPKSQYFTMNGRAVYEQGTAVLADAIQRVTREMGMSVHDLKAIVPHQPSLRVLKRTAEILEVPFEKFRTNLDRYANTAGATVPLLLDELHRADTFAPGDVIALAAVGAGWTWGAALYRW